MQQLDQGNQQQVNGQSGFQLPIRFILRPSNFISTTVLLAYIGGAVCVLLANIPVLFTQLSGLVLLVSFICWYYNSVYQPQHSPVELLLNDKDEWYLIDHKGTMEPLSLLPRSYVHTMFIILRFSQSKRNRAVILSFDNLPRVTFRRLRVRLLFTVPALKD